MESGQCRRVLLAGNNQRLLSSRELPTRFLRMFSGSIDVLSGSTPLRFSALAA